MKLDEPGNLKITVEKRGGKLIAKLPHRGGSMTTNTVLRIDDVFELYAIPDYLPKSHHDDLAKYLQEHNKLIPILVEAKKQINAYFGSSVSTLELLQDPEDEWEELFIVVKTKMSLKKALSILNKFRNEWFYHTRDGHDLNIKVEVI